MIGRKGSALIEVVVALAILSFSVNILLMVLTSQRPITSYTSDQMVLTALAASKMSEIEQAIRTTPGYYQAGYYYGFQYDPGSANDVQVNPADASNPSYAMYPGTFYKLGFPEYRYQFYITNGSVTNLKRVYLKVWRRPMTTESLILQTTLYTEVYGGNYAY